MTTVDNRNHTIHSSRSVGGVTIEVAPTDNKNLNTTNSLRVNREDEEVEMEEEKAIVDEEIDSMEGADFDDDDKMFQVALVNSVMETAGGGTSSVKQRPPPQQKVSSSSSSPGEEKLSPRSQARYGLRKRRRPGDDYEEANEASDIPCGTVTSAPTLPTKPPLVSHNDADKTTFSTRQIKTRGQLQPSSSNIINSTGGNAKTRIII